MRKLLGIIIGLFLTITTFSQSGVSFSVDDNYSRFTAQSFEFTFSKSYDIDQINKSASFYIDYFTVEVSNLNDSENKILIKLVEDTELSRRVISRFFGSLDINDIKVNGIYISIDDFMTNYIVL